MDYRKLAKDIAGLIAARATHHISPALGNYFTVPEDAIDSMANYIESSVTSESPQRTPWEPTLSLCKEFVRACEAGEGRVKALTELEEHFRSAFDAGGLRAAQRAVQEHFRERDGR